MAKLKQSDWRKRPFGSGGAAWRRMGRRLLQKRLWGRQLAVERHRSDPHLGEVVADFDEELSWLWRGGFAWKAGYGRLRRYQRFFCGMEERIQRLETQPLVKDEEKHARLAPLWNEWIAGWTAHPEAARFWEAGWMLAELRLLLFAPGQPREMKVSEKRVEKVLEGLR